MSRILYESCPLCGGEHAPYGAAGCMSHPLWVEGLPQVMKWHRCADCGHTFTAGYFDDDALELLYGGTNDDQRPGHDAERKRFVWAQTVADIARHAPPPATWLDVGFGDGSAIFVAAEFGFTVSGIDVRESVVADMVALGYDATHDAVECYGGGPFDVVTMFDILEHTPFPRDVLANVARLVAPGGLLAVSAPNADCESWRLLTEAGQNPYWSEIEHFHNFTRQSLAALLSDAGFTPISYSVSHRFRLGMEIIARRTA